MAAEIVNPRSDSENRDASEQGGGAAEPLESFDPAFALHRGGKMAVQATVPVRDKDDLSLAYTPGVAKVCSAIAEQPELVHDYTWKSSVVAVVTDGTAVLGLGDIGPEASLPVMEGKAILFKAVRWRRRGPARAELHGRRRDRRDRGPARPVLRRREPRGHLGPRCFEIERRLQERLDIPVFHDDQHGTAVVTLAALRNAARLSGRPLGELRAVISGAGAAGVAIAKMLVEAGIGDVAVADRKGVVSRDREDLTPIKAELASFTNKAGISGPLESALAGADVFIGVSGGTVPEPAVASMAEGAFVFAMANPNPEVHPEVAHKYAAVVATGRSDFPNQINNVLAFPGIFAGALQVRASRITEGMKLAAAEALAAVVGDDLAADYVIPSPFDERVAPAVTAAVAAAARAEGVARR